jgi:hypothetical protein
MKFYTTKDLIREMARAVDAGLHNGYDGKEHPELEKVVHSVLGVCHPITIEHLTKLANGTATLLETCEVYAPHIKLEQEMARYADAAFNGGFDGFEHPEQMKVVRGILNSLYPLTSEHLAAWMKGGYILAEKFTLDAARARAALSEFENFDFGMDVADHGGWAIKDELWTCRVRYQDGKNVRYGDFSIEFDCDNEVVISATATCDGEVIAEKNLNSYKR